MYTKHVAVVILGAVLLVLPPVLMLRYTVHNTKVIFFEAVTQCIKKGGDLTSIESAYQQNQIWNAIKKAGSTADSWWTSGTDLGLEGSWLWLSQNRRFGKYINFMEGEPNNDKSLDNCLAMIGGNKLGQWSDVDCNSTRYYVCQYSY
uniref:C-type lectin domain-containing protein n=1 Tax=Anopheles minimus TaxID=112268 RepID=A0A182WDF7_9DIPT